MAAQGVPQIDAAQHRINESLKGGNEQFENDDTGAEQHRHRTEHAQTDDKTGNDLEHDVPHRHVGHQSHRQAEGFGKQGNGLYRHDQRRQHQRNASGHKRAQIPPFPLADADRNVKQQRRDRQRAHRRCMRSKGKGIRKQSQNVAEGDKQKDRKDETEIFQPLGTDIFLHQIGDKTVSAFGQRLRQSGNDGAPPQAKRKQKRRRRHRQQHKQRGVGKRNVDVAGLKRNNRLDNKLFQRI